MKFLYVQYKLEVRAFELVYTPGKFVIREYSKWICRLWSQYGVEFIAFMWYFLMVMHLWMWQSIEKKYSDINQNKKSWAVCSTVYKNYILCKYVYQVRKFLVFYCKCSRIYFFKYSENFKEVKPNVTLQ